MITLTTDLNSSNYWGRNIVIVVMTSEMRMIFANFKSIKFGVETFPKYAESLQICKHKVLSFNEFQPERVRLYIISEMMISTLHF